MHSAHTPSDLPSATLAEPLPAEEGERVRDAFYLGLLAACISVAALFFFFLRGEILLYGDATAHIHIARRIFDSRTPGPMQLGTVWLPLPHLVILPFILSTWVWKLGFGASIPSMAAYVAGVIGVFRLVRVVLPSETRARLSAWAAALIYAANPNLLYLQATAMTEPLYLALFIWAAGYFAEFVQATRATGLEAKERRARALWRCGWVLFAAMMTRYDGWFAAAAFALVTVGVLWNWTGRRIAVWRSPLRPVVQRFILVLAIAPLLWLAYNWLGWGNPLEFATGPYSAHAIEARAERVGWHYPGWHAPCTAATYFSKSAKLNMAGGEPRRETEGAPRWRLENVWFPVAVLATLLLLFLERAAWPLLLLWLPLPFYTLSISWGGVPVFLPPWWPYSYYNVRYGLQLLPALAVFGALLIYFAGRLRWRVATAGALAALLGLTAASYLVVWRAVPICLREAHINSDSRVTFDRKIAAALEALPPGATVLAYTARHAAAFQFAGFPLRRTVNESNKKPWPEALAAPGHTTEYVLAIQTPDDPVWQAVQSHGEDFEVVTTIESPGQPRAVIYQRR
ncbi:MAG: hypothetical protein ACE14L_01630 [Terriglobales bacterium]